MKQFETLEATIAAQRTHRHTAHQVATVHRQSTVPCVTNGDVRLAVAIPRTTTPFS